MPLTDFQAEVLLLLASHRSEDSHLAGGAALHLEPNSQRFSNDLDFFHDSEVRVATAFAEDRTLLEAKGFVVDIEMNQPGYIRAVVSRDGQGTKIEWAHDMLMEADAFIRERPPEEVGCLYWSRIKESFVCPSLDDADVVPHYGRPGGVLPKERDLAPAVK